MRAKFVLVVAVLVAGGCSVGAAKKRCEELVNKSVAFAQGPDLNGAHTPEQLRSAFQKQEALFDDAERACNEAKATDRLAGIKAGRQSLATMRTKAEADAAAKLEADAAMQIEDARKILGRAKGALKNSDYKEAAPLLIEVLTAVAAAEEIRHMCIGLADAGACGDGGVPDSKVRAAVLQAMAMSWLEHGKEDSVIRAPRSKDSAELVEEVHALWKQNAARLNAAVNAGKAKSSAPENDEAAAKLRGSQNAAELLVPTYIRGGLKDPDSYEYVAGFGTGVPKGNVWAVTWTWRAKNGFGAVVQNTGTFCASAGTGFVAPCKED